MVQIIYEQSAHTGITNAAGRTGQDIGHRRAGQEDDKEAQTSVVIVLQLLYYNRGGLGTWNSELWGQSVVVAQ